MGKDAQSGEGLFDSVRTMPEQCSGATEAPHLVRVLRSLRRYGVHLLVLCSCSAAIGMVAWSDRESLYRLALLLILPALITRAPSRIGAFVVAWSYYGTATRSVPGIISGFFPGLSPGTSLALWFAQASLLALLWLVAYAPPGASHLRRVCGIVIALLALTLPPIGLFHWGSPLMAAGLLFPAWSWVGLIITFGLLIVAAAGNYRSRYVQTALIGTAMLAVLANAGYQTPTPPADWRAVSLSWGRSPELWSDEMALRRVELAKIAMQELARGARVIVFPESISGSNRREQTAIWRDVADAARENKATVLVGEEHWRKGQSSFRNALVSYGLTGMDGQVFVSSRVPMPVGDWKFGGADGADTDIWGSDVRTLQGQPVAFSICYEDFLLWTHRGLLTGRAKLLVSATNQWPSSGTSAEVAQDISRMALARLAGVALLTAKNH